MKSYGKFPLSYLSNITLELPGRLQEKINDSGQGFRFLNLTIICVLHRGPCLIYCLHSGSWDVWGNGLANNSLLQHKPWFISSISFSNSARGQNARRYNSVLQTFTNKIPLDYFFKKKNEKKEKKGLPTGGNLLSFTYPTSKTGLWEKQGIPLTFKLREELISVHVQHFPVWASPDGGWGKWIVRRSVCKVAGRSGNTVFQIQKGI